MSPGEVLGDLSWETRPCSGSLLSGHWAQQQILSVSLGSLRTDPAQATLPDVILNPGRHTEPREVFGRSEDRGTFV